MSGWCCCCRCGNRGSGDGYGANLGDSSGAGASSGSVIRTKLNHKISELTHLARVLNLITDRARSLFVCIKAINIYITDVQFEATKSLSLSCHALSVLNLARDDNVYSHAKQW